MTSRLPYARLSEFYDVGWGDFAESSLRFVTTTLKEYGVKKGRILELACGTGILAIHLAKAGHTVLGLDRSPGMVALARGKGQQLGNTEFRVADMRTFNVESTFDAVICLFDSINYLTELRDVETTINLVSSVLNRDGLLVFDFNRPIIYSAHSGKTLRRRVENGILLQELHYDGASRIARTVFRFPGGDVETHIQRAYELHEIEPLLTQAGLPMDGCFSDFSRRAVSSVSERLICVCQKS